MWRERLISGYQQFRAGDYPQQKALYEELGRHGQSPEIMLISCCDSRADPSDIFNAYPGEMFVLRNVANIVPSYDPAKPDFSTGAAIEYAATVLKVKAIVVMGHESCGGIKGCLDGMEDDPNGSMIGPWVSVMNGVRDRILAQNLPENEQAYAMELEGVRQSLRNLTTYPFIREAMASGELSLQGAYFSIIQAKLMLADKEGVFHEIETGLTEL